MGKKLKPKIHVRDSIVDFLHRTERFINSQEVADEFQIRFRLEKLEAKWDEFENIQRDIEEVETYEENIEEHRRARADFEETYFKVRAGLASKLPRQTPQYATQASTSFDTPGANSSSVHTYVRLPRINLPEFDGNYENWLQFHDTFRALIDSSPELSNIQKFHYLRASLKGDALKLIDSYPMSDANYEVAWNGLVTRFSNKYLLKKRHLNALLEFPKLISETAIGIHDIIDCFERNTKILDQLGETTNGWGAMLTHIMVSRLDDVTQQHWEEHAAQHAEPCYTTLVDFLKKRTRVLDAVSVDQRASCSNSSFSKCTKTHSVKLSVNSATEHITPSCIICGEAHPISRCSKFSNVTVDERLKLTDTKHLCSNCLGRNHLARDCPSKFRCRTCSEKHHTLLHPGFPASGYSLPSTMNNPSVSGDASNSGGMVSSSVTSISSNLASGFQESQVFLLTVLLKVNDKWGKPHIARAILDSGSQANLMSERFCQSLSLPRRSKLVKISGIGRSPKQTASEVSTVIASRISDFSQPMNFLVLNQITDDQPSTSIHIHEWKPPPDMKLADPGFAISGPIDMILGAQFFYDFHQLDGGRMQIIKINHDLPVFVNTVFGWVAAGGTIREQTYTRLSCNIATIDLRKEPKKQRDLVCTQHIVSEAQASLSDERSARTKPEQMKHIFYSLRSTKHNVANINRILFASKAKHFFYTHETKTLQHKLSSTEYGRNPILLLVEL